VHRICYGTEMMEVHGVHRLTDWTGLRQQHGVKSSIPDINTETWDERETEKTATKCLCNPLLYD
jgi:hypothetical protein